MSRGHPTPDDRRRTRRRPSTALALALVVTASLTVGTTGPGVSTAAADATGTTPSDASPTDDATAPAPTADDATGTTPSDASPTDDATAPDATATDDATTEDATDDDSTTDDATDDADDAGTGGDDGQADVVAAEARLVVADLTAVVGPVVPPDGLPPAEVSVLPGADVDMRLLVENLTADTLADVTLVVELESDVTDRVTLRTRLAGESTGVVDTAVLEDDLRIPTVAPRGVAQLAVRLSGEDVGFTPVAGSDEPLRIRPLRIALLRGATVLDEVRTAVVGLSGAPVTPLESTAVLPIDHAPWEGTVVTTDAEQPTSPDAADDADLDVDADAGAAEDEPVPDAVDDLDAGLGTTGDPVVPASLLPGGRVDRLTAAAEAAPAGTVAVAPAAHTVEALAAAGPSTATAAELVERIRGLSTTAATIVSTPFALARVPTLASSEDTRGLAALAVDDGRRRLGQALEAAPGASHLTVAPQTPTALDLVPGDLVVSRWDASAGVDLEADPAAELPPATRVAVAPSGRTLRVLVGDPWIEQLLAEADGVHGAVVDAHRVVLETAAAYLEDPATPSRALAIVPPVAWEPRGRTATEVTTRLAGVPWLRLTSPQAVAQRTGGDGAGWAPAPEPAGSLGELLPRFAEVTRRFDLLATAVPEGEAPPVFERRDDLLVAATAWPSIAPVVRAEAVLDQLDADLDDFAGTITVPADTTVTLASERGVVPVTIRRESGPPVDVVVEVSPQGRLVVEGGAARTVRLEEEGTATVGFDARALGTGTFPLRVDVRTPGTDTDGRALVLSEAIVSVRATAVSGPALLGIALFVLVLLLVGRRRRDGDGDDRDRPHLEVVR